MRINRYIIAPQVRVTKDNVQLGIMRTQDALDLAWRDELDLVEIVPHAVPPVCSIMDFGKFNFDQKKKEKHKQKAIAPKEIRLRPVSDEHDVQHKIAQLRRFLAEKRTVFVNIRFKNRELAHKENGRKILDRIVREVEEVGKADQQPRFEGSTLTVRLTPK